MSRDSREGDHTQPTRRASDRYSNSGILITAAVGVLALVAIAVLFGAFDVQDESAVEQTDNTMMGGGITGAEVEDVVEDENEGVAAPDVAE